MRDRRALFDGHLDLASLAVRGRDMSLELEELNERGEGPFLPGAVTLPELDATRVGWCLGTVFTHAGGDGAEGFPPGDAEAAHEAGVLQLDVYERWAREGWIDFAGGKAGVGFPDEPERLVVGILMENADPIRKPEELPWWVDRGVVAVALTWGVQGRYAGGNTCVGAGSGLTGLGRELLDAMEEQGVVLDVSHLSDAAMDEALRRFGGTVVASHSNCRSIVGVGEPSLDQRHLTDDAIQEIGRRGGVIGLNLVRNFIRPGIARDEPTRPTVSEALDHVEHVCEIAGSRAHVGLGTDLDGGITALDLPAEIDRGRDVTKLVEGLCERGWTDEELEGFECGNWLRVMRGRHQRT